MTDKTITHQPCRHSAHRLPAIWQAITLMLVFSLAPLVALGHSFDQGGGQDPEPPEKPACRSPQGATSSCQCTPKGHPIDPSSGLFYLEEADLVVSGVFPIRMVRRYDSQSRYDSPLGYGWAFTLDKRLYRYPDGAVIVRRDCGVRDRYVYTGGAYQPPVDRHTTLTAATDGTFTLTHPDHRKELYDLEGRLTELWDPRGNKLLFSYDPAGRLPLTGSSPYSLDPTTPAIVAYDYHLTGITEQLADGALTGHSVTLAYHPGTGRLETITASDGRQISYIHDQTSAPTNGNLRTVNGLDGINSSYDYTDTDPHNVTSTQVGAGTAPYINTYYTQDRVFTQIHGQNHILFDYALDTTVTETFKDAQGTTLDTLITIYEYDDDGFPLNIRRVLDDSTEYRRHYVLNGQKRITLDESYETPPGGTETLVSKKTILWDTAGNQTEEKIYLASGEIITTTRTFDHNWLASEETLSDTRPAEVFRTEYTFFYDGNGVPTNIKEEKRRKADGSFLTTAYTYDNQGRLATTTLPDTHKVVNVYTGDFLTKTYHELPGGGEDPHLKRRYGYDPHGNRNAITDGRGQSTQMAYDDQGRLRQVTNPLNEITHYRYTGPYLTEIEVGATAADGEGQVTRLNYSPEGFLESMDRKDDNDVYQRFVTYTLDSRGKHLSSKDALNRTTVFDYDALGRLLSVTDAKAKTTQYQYDALDNRRKVIDASLNETEYRYDSLNRLTRIEQQGITPSAITQLAYDAVGNLVTVTDPAGHTTRYVYDRLSRNTQVIQPLMQTVTHAYDDRGQVDYTLNARGNKLDYAYEAWGPLKETKFYADDSTTTVDRTITYGRDHNGNLTSITDTDIQPGALYTHGYDALDRPDIVTAHYLPGGNHTLDHDYDRYGNRQTLTVDGTLIHNYGYNKLNRLSNATLPGSQAFGFTYYATDEPQTVTYPNNVTAAYTYETNGPVQDITYTGTAGNLERYDYTYDNLLNIDTLTDTADGLHDFNYDNLNRLIQAQHPSANGLPASEDYAYDPVGNREDPVQPADYAYDSNNRITQSPGLTYTFDDDGNLTTRSDGAVFSYNHENRLTNYTKGATTATYAYDPLGRRLKKSIDGTTTWYLWDGDALIGEYNNAGALNKRYAYLADDYLPVQVEDANGVYNVHGDHLQTPKLLTDSTQQLVWRGRYEAFGTVIADEDPDGDGSGVVFDFRFPGQYFDQETGLHYNYFRDYDPGTGRYIESDPIGLDGGLNTYLYAVANPIRRIDP